MTDTTHAGWREALAEMTSRRTVLTASLAGTAGVLALGHAADAKKKRNKRKKRCKNGASRCGKACCKAPSICSAATCFCTGTEGTCTPVAQALIDLIAEALGIPPVQIGANPEQPLVQCPALAEPEKSRINALITQKFGVSGLVDWCDGGINAGIADIIEELTVKA